MLYYCLTNNAWNYELVFSACVMKMILSSARAWEHNSIKCRASWYITLNHRRVGGGTSKRSSSSSYRFEFLYGKCILADHCKSHAVIVHLCYKYITYDFFTTMLYKIHIWKYFPHNKPINPHFEELIKDKLLRNTVLDKFYLELWIYLPYIIIVAGFERFYWKYDVWDK